ncbi:Aste57867_1063 [Aphanomyces stellatus]|uniref:Aste57867_1063 protein n=1 Tax=Aphanomyces stellatus TaxID=120398 RepID=A0A485K4Q0_9STRA|nr:hypothetical protein As57867_001062 [Aphanomyces stellatus]VFT78285.1 Aste57867_1063 [Aphanomyces stellatus]
MILKVPADDKLIRFMDQQMASDGGQTATFFDKRVARLVFFRLQREVTWGKNVHITVGKVFEKPGLPQSLIIELIEHSFRPFDCHTETTKKAGTTPSGNNCSICMDSLDPDVMQLTLCGHEFCTSCIVPMVSAQEAKLLVACPECQREMSVDDCFKLISPEKLESFGENPVTLYPLQHAREFVLYPQPACNQILRVRHSMLGHTEARRSLVTTAKKFCMDCTAASAKAIEAHPRDSCQYIQSGINSDVMCHVQAIQNRILTLCCPKCKGAFFDFDGSTAVACGHANCRTSFCGACLEYFSSITAVIRT